MIDAASKTEAEVRDYLEQADFLAGSSAESDQSEVAELVKFAWDLDAYKKALKEAQLNTDKLPMGVLSVDRIKKSNSILA